MKVVFLESVEGTAQVGETKDVKNGFARNYLLPRGLAAPAVEPYLRRARARAIREEKHQQGLDQEATAVAERLEGARISILARVGEQGKLYGSVTSVHIAAEVVQLIGGEEFDHRKVLLPEAIREVGVQPVRLRLTRNVEATIEVEVIAEGEEGEESEEAAGQASEEPETTVDEGEEASPETAEASAEEEPEEIETTAEEPEATEPDAEAEAEETEEEET
jgi:large subunit ribosomal protein L9